MTVTPRFLILGNLDNRRVSGFVEALAARGQPPPLLRDHAALIAAPERLLELPDEPLWVRLESCGESVAVERALLRLGANALPDDHRGQRISAAELDARQPRFGELLAPRQFHAGYLAYLDRLAAVFEARPRWRILSPIADVRALFDKRETSRRYAAAGIPVPEALPSAGVTTPDELRAAMVERRWPAVFVKLSCASSASGLALYRYLPQRPPGQRELALTTVATTADGRFNSLRLQQLRTRAQVDALLDWLIAEGVQIERAVPKARVGGMIFDLRVLVVAGEPAFCVVRRSRHPITNLHLGGARGDLDGLRRALAPAAWRAAMASCAAVFAEHGCVHVGVDLLFEPGLTRHRIIEANAFGDLLPRLERDGLSVYEWEIEAVCAS